jgi:hypothetical protein
MFSSETHQKTLKMLLNAKQWDGSPKKQVNSYASNMTEPSKASTTQAAQPAA